MGYFKSFYELNEFAAAGLAARAVAPTLGRAARWAGTRFKNSLLGKPMTPEQEAAYKADMKTKRDLMTKWGPRAANAAHVQRAIGVARMNNDIEKAKELTDKFAQMTDELGPLGDQIKDIRAKWRGYRKPKDEWTRLGRATGGWVNSIVSGKRTKITEAVRVPKAKKPTKAPKGPLTPEQKKHLRAMNRLKKKHGAEIDKLRKQLQFHQEQRRKAPSERHYSDDSHNSGLGDAALGASIGMGIGSLFK